MNTHKLVPVEPTQEMIDAYESELNHSHCTGSALEAAIQHAPEVEQEPVGYANSDELDDMLDDRTATLNPVRNSFHTKPLYLHPQPAPNIDVLVAAMERLLHVVITTSKGTDLNYRSVRDAVENADTALCNFHKQRGEA